MLEAQSRKINWEDRLQGDDIDAILKPLNGQRIGNTHVTVFDSIETPSHNQGSDEATVQTKEGIFNKLDETIHTLERKKNHILVIPYTSGSGQGYQVQGHTDMIILHVKKNVSGHCTADLTYLPTANWLKEKSENIYKVKAKNGTTYERNQEEFLQLEADTDTFIIHHDRMQTVQFTQEAISNVRIIPKEIPAQFTPHGAQVEVMKKVNYFLDVSEVASAMKLKDPKINVEPDSSKLEITRINIRQPCISWDHYTCGHAAIEGALRELYGDEFPNQTYSEENPHSVILRLQKLQKGQVEGVRKEIIELNRVKKAQAGQEKGSQQSQQRPQSLSNDGQVGVGGNNWDPSVNFYDDELESIQPQPYNLDMTTIREDDPLGIVISMIGDGNSKEEILSVYTMYANNIDMIIQMRKEGKQEHEIKRFLKEAERSPVKPSAPLFDGYDPDTYVGEGAKTFYPHLLSNSIGGTKKEDDDHLADLLKMMGNGISTDTQMKNAYPQYKEHFDYIKQLHGEDKSQDEIRKALLEQSKVDTSAALKWAEGGAKDQERGDPLVGLPDGGNNFGNQGRVMGGDERAFSASSDISSNLLPGSINDGEGRVIGVDQKDKDPVKKNKNCSSNTLPNLAFAGLLFAVLPAIGAAVAFFLLKEQPEWVRNTTMIAGAVVGALAAIAYLVAWKCCDKPLFKELEEVKVESVAPAPVIANDL